MQPATTLIAFGLCVVTKSHVTDI